MSERRFLPVIDSDQPLREKSVDLPEDVLETRARRFLRYQRYPLSDAGLAVQQELADAVARKDSQQVRVLAESLPTVENPRLDLFEDLALPEAEQKKIFADTANIQVTKGCTHGCLFCTVSASNKLETMPYPAVLKIAEKIYAARQPMFNKLVKQHTPDAVRMARHLAGLEAVSERVKKPSKELALQAAVGSMGVLCNYYDSDPLDYRDASFLHTDGTPADYGDVARAMVSPISRLGITTAGLRKADMAGLRAVRKLISLKKDCQAGSFTLDGKPFQFNPFGEVRLSVNKYESRARRDMGEYLEEMLYTIEMMEQLNPQILLFVQGSTLPDDRSIEEIMREDLFGSGQKDMERLKRFIPYDEDREFFNKVILPISRFVDGRRSAEKYRESSKMPLVLSKVSFFSGPLKREDMLDKYHDVAKCMPGYHIWPDGSMAVQKRLPSRELDQVLMDLLAKEGISPSKFRAKKQIYLNENSNSTVPRGSRPERTGRNLFKLKKSN